MPPKNNNKVSKTAPETESELDFEDDSNVMKIVDDVVAFVSTGVLELRVFESVDEVVFCKLANIY